MLRNHSRIHPEIQRTTLKSPILAVTVQAKLKNIVKRGLKNNIQFLGWTLLLQILDSNVMKAMFQGKDCGNNSRMNLE